MTLPTGLFVEAPEMQDVSMHQLGQDTEAWPEEIIQKLKERVPQVNGMNTIVKFMKQDEENGAATGSVVIGNAKKVAIVPVIIKDFMMYPLDVMISDSKLLPLTPDYFRAVFDSNDLFQRLEEYPAFSGIGRFEDANLWNATYPPSLGRYAYASAGYPLCDIIMETVDGSEFKKYLQENPAVAAGFHKHGHAELVKKLANLRPVNMNEYRQGADNLIPRSILMLRNEGPNKYSVLSNSDKVFSPAFKPLKRKEFGEFLSTISDRVTDEMNEVDQNGEKLLIPPGAEDPVVLASPDKEIVEKAEEFDHYVVKKKNGVSVEGMVIPIVIDLEMGVTGDKIFIGKTMSTLQGDIAGVRIKNSRFDLPACQPSVGQTGTFVFQANKSKALATVPFTIKSITQYEGIGEANLVAMDLMGRAYKIRMKSSDELQRIVRLPESGEYLLPSGFKWVPMDGFQEVSNNAVDYAAKTAAEKMDASITTLISTGYDQWSIKGISKYARAMDWDETNLQNYQAKFLLASLGMGTEKIAEAMKVAKRSGRALLHGLKTPPLKEEKLAAALPLARKMSKTAEAIRCNLVKEASYIENSQTVDTLLALNFVGPDNITKFVGKIPQLKAVVSTLASCLIASRLGMQEIPEHATSTSMYRLIDVINGLEALRASQDQAPIGGGPAQ